MILSIITLKFKENQILSSKKIKNEQTNFIPTSRCPPFIMQ